MRIKSLQGLEILNVISTLTQTIKTLDDAKAAEAKEIAISKLLLVLEQIK